MIAFPRFAYLYTRRGYPARGVAAWAVLRQVYPKQWCYWLQAQRLLRQTFGTSARHVRSLLQNGEGTFWRRRLASGSSIYAPVTIIEFISLDDLWVAVRDESVVDHKQIVLVPEEALRSVLSIRAHLSQTVLTRGDKPVSLAYSAGKLRRGMRSVTAYRALLLARGAIKIEKQYVRREKIRGLLAMDTRLPDERQGQFGKDGYLWQRLPDIVTLLEGSVELRPRMPAAVEEMRPRRYFSNYGELDRWASSNLPVSSDALVSEITEGRPSGQWETYLFRADGRTEYSKELELTSRGKGTSSGSQTAPKLVRFRALQRRRGRVS